MNEELKPCPFCGSKTLFPREVYLGKITGKRWYVWCKNCGAFGGSRNTKQESIDAWNRRVNERNREGGFANVKAKVDSRM